jgi:protease-4
VKRRLLWLAAALCVVLGCEGRPRIVTTKSRASEATSYGSGTLEEVDLSNGVPESTEAGGWLPLPAARTFVGLVRTLERLRDGKKVSGLFISLGQARLHLSQVEELNPLLRAIRTKRTPIVCHAHVLDNALLWLVTEGCDKLWLSPAGSVESIGIAAQSIYIKGLLDELKIQADFLSIGRYKSAAEMFTRQGPSDEARLALSETLQSMRNAWLQGMASARGPADKFAENGPYGANEAKGHGLVDALGDVFEARKDARQLAHAGTTRVAYGPAAENAAEHNLTEILRLLSGADAASDGKPYIAVVPAIGGITMKSDGLFSGEGIVFESLAKTISRLSDDSAVKAVVLRIDSPGGSALASDLLWSRLRELGAKKPLVASVGSMAASGGYYLACAAQSIVAGRTSIVGSIGVLGGKIVFGSALEAHGVHTVTTPASSSEGAAERAAYLSPFVPWDEATRVRLRLAMSEVYDLFVERVATGRHLAKDQVQAVAEGRIWSGEQGKERGLVDEFGGLAKALEIAREKAGLPKGIPVHVEGPAEGLLAALGLDAHASSDALTHALDQQRRRLWSPLALAPHSVTPWITGLTPLLASEHTLALLPVAVTVE